MGLKVGQVTERTSTPWNLKIHTKHINTICKAEC